MGDVGDSEVERDGCTGQTLFTEPILGTIGVEIPHTPDLLRINIAVLYDSKGTHES